MPGGELRSPAPLLMAAPVRASPDSHFHANRCPSWHEGMGRRAVSISPLIRRTSRDASRKQMRKMTPENPPQRHLDIEGVR